jgi:hypothetical protein
MLVVIALVLALVRQPWEEAEPYVWMADSDNPSVILVDVWTCNHCDTHVHISETSSTIRIVAFGRDPHRITLAIAVSVTVEVHLKSAVGARRVLDQHGDLIPQRVDGVEQE